MRSDSRLPIVSRAAGIQARRLRVGIDERRRQLERVDAERLLDDAADFRRRRAGQRARGALAQQLLLRRDVGAVLAELDVLPGRHVAEQQAEHLDLRQRRIGFEGRASADRACRRRAR